MALDVNVTEQRTLGKKYTVPVRIAQLALTAADTTVFAIRNTGTKDWSIDHLDVTLGYGGSALSGIRGYSLQRFSAATPTGGTAITPCPNDSNDAALTCDARFAATGLTVTNVSFGAIISHFLRDIGYSSTSPLIQDWRPDSPIIVHPNEGICVRIDAASATAIGMGLSMTMHITEG